MTHQLTRPVPAKRLFASLDTYYPTRESDGPAYIGVMYDTRQLRISTAREAARENLEQARKARIAGDADTWDFCMVRAAGWRQEYAKRSRA